MEAKDGSIGFDFTGTYTKVVEHKLIESTFGDRVLLVEFIAGQDGVTVRETFDAEATYPVEQQRQGWQAILNSFKIMLSLVTVPDRSSAALATDASSV